MKILVACELPEFALDELRTLGLPVEFSPDLSADELPGAIADVTLLIVSRLRVSPEAIAAGKSLQLIVCWDADTSNIAVEEASNQGILVASGPETNAVAIAELAIGLLIALDRDLVSHAHDLRGERRRDSDGLPTAMGLAGRSLGMLQLGEVGRSIARRLRGFGVKVLAWAPGLTPEEAQLHGIQYCAWPGEVGRDSEMIVVYAADASEAARVDESFLNSVRDGALLVYIGHPGGFEESALLDAVERRGLKVAIDVLPPATEHASIRYRTELFRHPGVIGTFRLANRTQQALHASARRAVETIRRFLVSGEIDGAVNLVERSPATWLLVLRLRDTVGIMAQVMDAIRADGINAEEITTRVFKGARAAWCTVALDERPGADTLAAIRKVKGVLHLELRAMV